ncbi:MAG: dihydrolipoamide acetyltransferase family protein [Tepidisphaeraceae bacterium]|jgi:pyruvate dehydrogenase E2 component (dihydrolipoamide acetyltransferase)
MPAEITMPQLSDTMTEGTLVKWLKKEGDRVESGDKIAEVETDKAVMEMESFESGTLAAILVPEGQKVAVGSVMAVVATGKDDPAEVKQQAAAAGPRRARSGPPATLEAASTGEIHEADYVGHVAVATGQQPAGPPLPKLPENVARGVRVRISPLARRMAAEKNIDPRTLLGSGPGGRVVVQDVLALTDTAAARSVPLPHPGSGQTQTVPVTKMRAAIGKALQSSKQRIPHFYETVEADVEELSAMRLRMNQMLEPQNIHLSLADFVVKALAMTLLAHPALNATFNGIEVTRYGDVHLGIAVAVPDGLIVPVLRNIHLMGLKEIRQRSVDLAERARAQKLRQEEMSGATFTVTNLGRYGVKEFSAIINPPEVGILAVGAAEKRPAVRNGQLVARTMMSLTLSADHRVVDGAMAAEFLRTLKQFLEEPGMMLVFA